MHQGFFAMKRGHWSAVRVGKLLLRSVGLTPARFDMMWVIALEEARTAYLAERGALQRDVREALGVSRMTTSVMMRSIEALGWVVRTRAESDRRTYLVRLTERGTQVLAWARELTRKGRVVGRVVMEAIVNPPSRSALLDFSIFEWGLKRMRRGLGDTATLEYPWYLDH